MSLSAALVETIADFARDTRFIMMYEWGDTPNVTLKTLQRYEGLSRTRAAKSLIAIC
ncbi:hypothetical protein CLBKND_04762 [Methylorubrum aminovorans]